tara:strand:- start:380 stop:493 length:114 start_codon:yes stop_codon:yes gene_type:complete
MKKYRNWCNKNNIKGVFMGYEQRFFSALERGFYWNRD